MTEQEISRLCGWRPDWAEPAYEACRAQFTPFIARHFPEEAKKFPIWKYTKKANGGKHIPTVNQGTGDCVSQGARHGVIHLSGYEIGRIGEEETFKIPFAPWIYGTSRMEPDCGNGQLGRGAGSTGAWAITAMKKYGILFECDEGVPSYSGSVADQWGRSRSAYEQFRAEASDNPIKKASRLTSVDQVRASLLAYEPVTFACMYDFGTGAVEKQGYRVLTRGGGGGHQVSLLWWIDDPFPAAFMQNSWGPGCHTGPAPLDEPDGGAWMLEADIERHIRSRYCEAYSISTFEGDPSDDPNWSPV